MSIFALKRIEAIDSKQTVDKLIVNNNCQFDEFEENLLKTKKYQNEIGMIYTYLEYISNGQTLPAKHFKDITPDKEKIKEYEFKRKHLRIYAIKKKNGKIILLGGYKNKQAKDINKFRAIKKQYIESLKP
jgi:putative component of toxin-antitoxin plasmid stabilization module